MQSPTILVTGATGKTGTAVVSQLRQQQIPVRAVVRSIDSRSDWLARLGAEVVVADLFDHSQMLAAMRGTQRAYFCPPVHPHMLQSAVVFATAARDASLESIVGLSQWLASPVHPAYLTRQHWLADRLFDMVPGTSLTIVNPGFFADLPYMALLRYAALLGVFPLPGDGEARNAPPSNEDIAAVVVASLLDPGRHAGKIYRPTGPEMLSIQQMVDIIGLVLQRKVRRAPLPQWLLLKAARMDGNPQSMLAIFGYYLQDNVAGAFALGGVTQDVLNVTGRPAESFETIVRRHAAHPSLEQTLSNKARALAQFMTVPFRPGCNPRSYARQHGFPLPEQPLLAMQNESWKTEHSSQTLIQSIATASPASRYSHA